MCPPSRVRSKAEHSHIRSFVSKGGPGDCKFPLSRKVQKGDQAERLFEESEARRVVVGPPVGH